MAENGRLESRGVRGIRSVVTGCRRALEAFLGLAMGVMLVTGVTQVVARYVLEISLVWPEETARYMMVTGTFLAIPVLTLSRGQIAVDAVMHYLRRPGVRGLVHRAILAVELVVIAIITNLAYTNFTDAQASGSASAGMGVPLAWPMAAVAAGCALGVLATAALLVLTFLEPRDRWVPLGDGELDRSVATPEGATS